MEQTATYKYISATGLVHSGPTQLYSVTVSAGDAAAGILTLRDWTTTTGGAIVAVVKAAARQGHSGQF